MQEKKEVSVVQKIAGASIFGLIGGGLVGGMVGFIISMNVPEKHGFKVMVGCTLLGMVAVGAGAYKMIGKG